MAEHAKELDTKISDEVITKKDSHSFKCLKKEPEPDEDGQVEDSVLTGRVYCLEFKRMVNFEIEKLAWETSHEVYEDHLCYIGNAIIKLFSLTAKELVLCFDKMYFLKKYLSPPDKRDNDAFNANWSKKDQHVSFAGDNSMSCLPVTRNL